MNSMHAHAASVLLAAAQDLLATQDAPCECSPSECESGHRATCWMPCLQAAIVKASHLADAGSGVIVVSREAEKLVANFNALPPELKPYILRAAKEIRKYAGLWPEGFADALGSVGALSTLHAWEREFYQAIKKHALFERARVGSMHDLEG